MADSITNLDTISVGQGQKEETANELFDAASPASMLGRRATTTEALTWGYYGGVVRLDDGSLLRKSNGVLALTDDATNYIELDTADGSVDQNTSGWSGGKKRLYEIVTSGGVVTSYTDWRSTMSLVSATIGSVAASNVSVADVGGNFGSPQTVEAALAELADAIGSVPGGDVEGPGSPVVDNHLVQWDGTSGTLIKDGIALDTDGTLAANSDTRVATQKAVKTFVENAVTGLWDLKGATDCSANPNYPAASKGDAYVVSVAGKIGGASGTSVDVGDVYTALADNAGGTEAAVGASWFHLEHNLSGVALTSGNLSQFAATTSAQLAGVISDETGSGALVFANSPALVTPNIGTPTAGTLTNCTGLPVAGGGTGAATLTNHGVLLGQGTSPVAATSAGTAGQVLQSGGAGADPAWADQPIVIVPFFPGVPTASQLVAIFPAPAGITTISFAAALSGAAGKALTAATAQTDFDLRKNATTSSGGSSVGTIRFAASGTVPTFIAASGFTLGSGDYLTLWAPATPDATLANFAISLYATRS